MKKPGRILVILVVVQLFVSFLAAMPAYAFRYEKEANSLHDLGIYAGCNTQTFDPDLGSRVQRQTAVILLVKMFGEKEAADALSLTEIDQILSAYSDNHLLAPFSRSYMAYAVKTGMVAGTSRTTLGPEKWIDGVSFACMILKKMGYTVDSREKFLRSLEKLGEISGMDAQTVVILNRDILTKDEIVGIIYAALQAALPDGKPLMADLIYKGFVSAQTAADHGFILTPSGTTPMMLPGYTDKPTDRELIYDLIRQALLAVSPSVTLPNNTASDTAEEVFAIWQQVLSDTPEILYQSSLSYKVNSGQLSFDYKKGEKTTKEHMDLLERKVESLLKDLIKPGMTDYQKELVIHDYLVNHCTYDLSANQPPESFSAYGALCLGKAVCDGYARATKLLLNRAGVECLVVIGEALNKDTGRYQGHAWNMVNIDGHYYQLDTTWNDPVMADGSNRLVYTYFNLTDEDIRRDHRWDGALYPVCVATDYNYYVYNDLIAIGYDAFVSYAVGKVNQGNDLVTAKISHDGHIDFDLNKALKDIQSRTSKRIYAYKPVDCYGIIELFFK